MACSKEFLSGWSETAVRTSRAVDGGLDGRLETRSRTLAVSLNELGTEVGSLGP